MKKLSFRKKMSLYFLYRRIIMENKEALSSEYNIRIDRVNRLYTVINIPTEIFEEPYNLRASDINKISEPYILNYTKQIASTLESMNMAELFKLYNVKKVDKYSYLIVIGFSVFNTQKVARNILLKLIPSVIVIGAISLWFLK